MSGEDCMLLRMMHWTPERTLHNAHMHQTTALSHGVQQADVKMLGMTERILLIVCIYI
jgi:hypothetical protein